MNYRTTKTVDNLFVFLFVFVVVMMLGAIYFQIKDAKAEEPKQPAQHFELLHTTKLDKSLSVKEVLDRDTVQHYLVFEDLSHNGFFVVYKQPPLMRPLGDCIDGQTGNLCASPLIKNPYGMNSFFVYSPKPAAKQAPAETKKE